MHCIRMRCVTLRCRRRGSARIARHDPLPTTMHPYRDTTGIKGISSNETQLLKDALMRYTQGEVTSQNLWPQYNRHFVGITEHNVRS